MAQRSWDGSNPIKAFVRVDNITLHPVHLGSVGQKELYNFVHSIGEVVKAPLLTWFI